MPAKDSFDYCCDDDWAIWLRFETWIWALLLLIQMSMVAFVVIRGRKDSSFRQAFYVFFVAVSTVDCVLALLVSKGGITLISLFVLGSLREAPPERRFRLGI